MQLRALFPWPLVGVALVLATMIVLTPVIFGPLLPGSLETTAELLVDHPTDSGPMNFYVRAYDATVRYDSISIAYATGFAWTGAYPSGPLNWTGWQNGSNVLSLQLLGVGVNPVAINVSVLYTYGGASALYVGLLAFDWSLSGSTYSILAAVSPLTPGVSVPGATDSGSLPLVIYLQNFGAGPSP